MKMLVLAVTTAAAVLTTTPLLAGSADTTEAIRLAQVDVYVAPPRPGVVIEERRRPGVVIDTEGRRNRDCRSVTVREMRNGERITRTERRCD